jgi:cell division protein FtsQ
MNRRKTIDRGGYLRRAFAQRKNRRLRSAEERATTPVRFRELGLLAGKTALLTCGAFVISFVSFVVYSELRSTRYFDVSRIEIRGVERASLARIWAQVDPLRGRSTLTLDLAKVEDALAADTWLKMATVSRQLPSTLSVEVVEHRPLAATLMGNLYLVNEDGQIFRKAEMQEANGLPVITGISRKAYKENPERAKKRLNIALGALGRYRQKASRPRLSEINLGELDEITFYLRRGGVALHFGKGLSNQRLSRLDAVWAALGTQRNETRAVFLDSEQRTNRVIVRLGRQE